jgi:hypothetical protein
VVTVALEAEAVVQTAQLLLEQQLRVKEMLVELVLVLVQVLHQAEVVEEVLP